MFQSYEQIFTKRADAYQKAMELYPGARDREFQLTVEAAGIRPGDIVCDAPSGGGYLRAYLPDAVQRYLAVETAPDFTGHCPMGGNDRIVKSPLNRIELDDNSNNSMGHEGLFLDMHTTGAIVACGLSIDSDELMVFPWSFESREDMSVYCKLLFGMDLADTESVIGGIEDILGYMTGPGKVNMAWSLRFITAFKL